ncbi:MBL fold metallo-hydrolase [Sphingomonas sp. SUN019]|uniref:MBL fold metallo-hydrolase n=1 Tax=Sphingomonas sp. SUN019 TaxID=2937788 RepID=UPI002164D608|nr:MBL fold metallo-hydrolase [Sphingomonas sp. SUN019]UVO49982.1 MBL fold metallo-hydrolase [Sphingomonas sp. SUN019]
MPLVLKLVGATLLFLIVAAALAITIVPRFLDRIYYDGRESDHFDGARFFNPDGVDDTLAPPTGGSRAGFFWRYFTGSDGRPPWPASVPVTPTKPAARIEGERMVVTWVGHASVLIQTQGLNILTDPVWANSAGPLGLGPKRVAAPGVRLNDLPKIDLILVSHNHYDHLDKATLKQLWERDKPRIVTSLGNDSIIAQVGARATALDWGEAEVLGGDGWRTERGIPQCDPDGACPGDRLSVFVMRNHHWSSRWFADRNRALWSSFVVTLPSGGNLFFAGDTGLGDGKWPAEAAALGPIRLALIPIGAFRFVPGQMGSGSHIGPIDAVRVFDRLGAARAIPIHWGTFRLSYEERETPPRMLDLLLRCTGGDPARFAPAAFGEPVEIALYTAPTQRPDESLLATCADRPEIKALR